MIFHNVLVRANTKGGAAELGGLSHIFHSGWAFASWRSC